jgi:iron complex outermembrane recepter protein
MCNFLILTTAMKKIFVFLMALVPLKMNAQQKEALQYIDVDTVYIKAFGQKPLANIPYQVQRINLKNFQATPRPQLMQQLVQLPSVSSITSGVGINKPVIRGLSFNHIQLFANGTRIDNQTWDDRHDIGIAENGFDRIEIISGPAALVYGPNTLGGAMIMEETVPAKNEKNNGYARLGFFGNSLGANLNAGFRGTKNDLYYSVHAGVQAHANYVQGEGKEKEPAEEEESLAANSKFNNVALKGMIGIRKAGSDHRFTYNLYNQNLGIVEDESMDSAINGGKKEEERDYEMEAPYQHVTTHLLSFENSFKTGTSEITFNAGYQHNKRSEFEPDSLPKSKFLGVGLSLQTLTADLQWHSDKSKASSVTVGVQGFYQHNKNNGNFVLVPDANVSTIGAFVIGNTDYRKWNFLYGIRIDAHRLKMFTTLPKLDNGEEQPATPAPMQNITRNYTPYSFSAGVVYHPANGWSIKLNAANGYAAPNYAHLTAYGKHEGTYRFEIGDNSLRMEKNIEADAGIEYRNASVTLGINGYSNSINNYIYINPTQDSAGDLQVYRWTQHDALINGIEANINIHPQTIPWFETYLRAGIIRGKLKDDAGELPYIPANKFIAGLTFKKDAKKWKQLYATLQLSGYGKQNKVAHFEEATAGYFLADIFVGASPSLGKDHRWSFTVFCTNLLNKGYFNHLSLVKTIDVREPGRNIGVQATYLF